MDQWWREEGLALPFLANWAWDVTLDRALLCEMVIERVQALDVSVADLTRAVEAVEGPVRPAALDALASLTTG